jgi:primase-polymerase (primpol)-like protein
MVCSRCSTPISPLVRGDSRYCSSRCRLAAHRALPARELRDRARWIRRSATKVPLTIDGNAASSTDPSTWCDYDTAAASTVGAGLGFVLNGDGIVCVDLDHCLDGRGRPQPWVIDLLESMPETYVEVSPSGDGLHVWGFGTIGKGRRSGGIEVYGRGRYLTITNKRWRHSVASFANLDEWIGTLPI